LGEFLPFGRFFTLGGLLKNTRVALILGHFFHGKRYIIIFDKNGLGYVLGHLFAKLIWSPWSGLIMAAKDFEWSAAYRSTRFLNPVNAFGNSAI
jgi:hypothetical protein